MASLMQIIIAAEISREQWSCGARRTVFCNSEKKSKHLETFNDHENIHLLEHKLFDKVNFIDKDLSEHVRI